MRILASIDVIAADHFFTGAQNIQKASEVNAEAIKKSLQGDAFKYLADIGVEGANIPMCESEWIKYEWYVQNDTHTSSAQGATKQTPTTIAPRIIKFDEKTGRGLNSQVEVTNVTPTTETLDDGEVVLPCR